MKQSNRPDHQQHQLTSSSVDRTPDCVVKVIWCKNKTQKAENNTKIKNKNLILICDFFPFVVGCLWLVGGFFFRQELKIKLFCHQHQTEEKHHHQHHHHHSQQQQATTRKQKNRIIKILKLEYASSRVVKINTNYIYNFFI